jgi:hypothetical protein
MAVGTAVAGGVAGQLFFGGVAGVLAQDAELQTAEPSGIRCLGIGPTVPTVPVHVSHTTAHRNLTAGILATSNFVGSLVLDAIATGAAAIVCTGADLEIYVHAGAGDFVAGDKALSIDGATGDVSLLTGSLILAAAYVRIREGGDPGAGAVADHLSLYATDVAGTTVLAYRDSAGVEHVL